ncbi:MAG: SAM-dependent chlorinase/fluorinase [Bacteroidales bacterium]|jgi:S-adenosylmethionine hydrolase|nr:SAM-dependent chlorinase/fluorinase [Bacteroidales bacterium]
MSIVTLTTDWGYKDFYLGKFKGRLISEVPNVQIVDITHNIKKYDINATAFITQNACFDFPTNTIHLIDVAAMKSHVLVVCNEQYFLCSDNVIPSLLFYGKEIEIYSLKTSDLKTNFIALDLYIPIIKMLYEGKKPEQIGERQVSFANIERPCRFAKLNDYIECHVIHIDNYGNATLDITEEEFKSILSNQPTNDFYIVAAHGTCITQISPLIIDKDDCIPILGVSSSGFLQLALSRSSYIDMFHNKDMIPSNMQIPIHIYLGQAKK